MSRGAEDVETRTPLPLRGATPALPGSSPAAPPRPSFRRLAPGHALRLLYIRLERHAPCAKRPGPRTTRELTLPSAATYTHMRPRMEKKEEGRGRGREEKRESGTCVTRRASTRSPHRLRRGGEGGGGEMMDGDGDEESAHDVRRPAAPHTPPVACAEREGHRWGGRSVGSHRCSGWGRQERAQARDLSVLCAHLPLRPLRARPFIVPPGRGSAPSASITHHDRREHPTIHRCDSDGDGVGSDVGGALGKPTLMREMRIKRRR
jgi:hypothetical protein